MGIILGSNNDDQIIGTTGIDAVTALGGNDSIIGNGGIDVLDGGAGNDVIYAGTKTQWDDSDLDTVLGGAGDDTVYGGIGDILNGGTGFDRLSLDLSLSTSALDVDFRPMTILDVTGLLKLSIGTTELSGFESIDQVRGSAFGDRIIVENQQDLGSTIDGNGGNDMIRATRNADVLDGGDGNDLLKGLNGNDVLVGGAGNDRIDGGKRIDTLTGGTGADRFLFHDGDTSVGRANADVVTDFNHAEHDKIDLRGIDAIVGGDDDSFHFIRTAAFSGTAGELRYSVVDGNAFVSGDTNGDGTADFNIELSGVTHLVQGDFSM